MSEVEMSGLDQDIRVGFRLLRPNPVPAITAMLTLGLGIAVNTTVFGWIDNLFLRPMSSMRFAGKWQTSIRRLGFIDCIRSRTI